MLNILDYCAPGALWPGIRSYAADHRERYALPEGFDDDALLGMLKKNAKAALPPNEYDAFRKAITALKKGTANSLKKENLYRLCYVLQLGSDTQAQNLFLNYLHQNELSARSLDEFILITALKLRLSWKETSEIRQLFQKQIASQPLSPSALWEGDTAEVYHTVIHEQLHTKDDLIHFLGDPENLAFFAKTRNTQYLALFDDVELEVLYQAEPEQLIRMVADYGNPERETIQEYYHSLFGLQDDSKIGRAHV